MVAEQLLEQKLSKKKITKIQINLGNLCNQSCEHCHVNASPVGKNNMEEETARNILSKLQENFPGTVEFTGGAPEMNPNLTLFIEALSGKCEIVVRSNLTVLGMDQYSHYIALFKKHNVKIISSLPSVFEDLTDSQRGKGVFSSSIRVLKKLNSEGYGNGILKLDLVYNPSGDYLPPPQVELETRYKSTLLNEHGITFDNLVAITNNPINRFRKKLLAEGKFNDYFIMLKKKFNSGTLNKVMCRNIISVDYRGYIYDCDFNQAMGKRIKGYEETPFWEVDFSNFVPEITLDEHCYACTANEGSSCHGTLAGKEDSFDVKGVVSRYYGEELSSTSDLKTSACCSSETLPPPVKKALEQIADEVVIKFYGCGSPIPQYIEGVKALDLGCGTGRDVYVLSKLAGRNGKIAGIDMTANQINVAKKYVEHQSKVFGFREPNVRFIHDEIENLDKHFPDGSLDLVTSNCVINLVEDKQTVLNRIYAVLKNGGEFYFSDVYADRRIPDEIRENEVIYGECLGGALYMKDFLRMARKAGFADPRVFSQREISVDDPAIKRVTGNIRFYSITYRLWKLEGLEDACEDYGHVAVYRGGLEDSRFLFTLDEDHTFELDKPERVCGNTAKMLSETRYEKFFEVTGSFKTHFGFFKDCKVVSDTKPVEDVSGNSGCC